MAALCSHSDQLWKVSAAISAEAEEPVAALLERNFGQAPSVYCDAESGAVTAELYLARAPSNLPGILHRVRRDLRELKSLGLNPGPATVRVTRIRRENWAESWKRHFNPITISDRLLIKPSWSRKRARKDQAVIVLDPGLSFGTGHHATTAFCLEQLVALRKEAGGQSFLDIGTGSGILAIAAAKLGYSPIEAFDFDPEAVRVARQNSQGNGVGNQVRPVVRDLTKLPLHGKRRHDVVCANLIDDLLCSEARRISERVKPGGVVITSGILATQFPKVQAAYEHLGFKLIETRRDKEWQSAALERL